MGWARLMGWATLAEGDLLRDPAYRRLWTSILTSAFGAQITMLALPLTAAVLLNASPTQMGLLTTVELLPFILFSLPSGVWLDRVRKLPVYIGGEVTLAVAVASVPVAAAGARDLFDGSFTSTPGGISSVITVGENASGGEPRTRAPVPSGSDHLAAAERLDASLVEPEDLAQHLARVLPQQRRRQVLAHRRGTELRGTAHQPESRAQRVIPFVHHAAGPDLREIVVGSEGALGVLTEVTLRVRPRPEAGLYEANLDIKQAYTTRFVNKRVGLRA